MSMSHGWGAEPAPAETSVQRRRGLELALLGFVLAIAVLAYVAVEVGYAGTFPAHVGLYAGAFAALFLVTHLAVRRLAPYADPLFLPLAFCLNVLGLVLIHRLDLSAAAAARRAGHPAPRGDAVLQLTWTAIGVLLFLIVLVLVRDHRVLARYRYTAMAAGLLLLLVPAVLPSRFSAVNGAKIWVRVAGLSFQPGEVAKILLLVFFAGYFVAKRDLLTLAGRRVAGLVLPRGRDLGPVAIAWLVALAVLVLEHDLGTSLLFFGIFVAMLYVATERVSWVLIGLVAFAGGAWAAYHLIGHVRERVDIWLHPFAQAQAQGYQLVQGLFGLANGGILGTGLGRGRPDIVPFANTDFIFSTLGEELGLAGVMAVLVIYGLFTERGLRAALLVQDPFGKLLAAGLSFALVLQVFVVVGGVTRLIPLTGMTLPFMSYGGSSLVANWILVALLLRVSDASRRPRPAQPPPLPLLEDAPTQVVHP